MEYYDKLQKRLEIFYNKLVEKSDNNTLNKETIDESLKIIWKIECIVMDKFEDNFVLIMVGKYFNKIDDLKKKIKSN